MCLLQVLKQFYIGCFEQPVISMLILVNLTHFCALKCILAAILDLEMGAILNLKHNNNIIWEQMCLLYDLEPFSIGDFVQSMILMLI